MPAVPLGKKPPPIDRNVNGVHCIIYIHTYIHNKLLACVGCLKVFLALRDDTKISRRDMKAAWLPPGNREA